MTIVPIKAAKGGAPSHLRPPTQAWWRQVTTEFELQPHHLKLLLLCCEALDRCEGAREALAEHGTTYADKDGNPHSRPEIAVERDSRIAFSRLLRELDLDTEAAPPPSGRRPPMLRSNRRTPPTLG